jgi:uncharacterized integral membrane protein
MASDPSVSPDRPPHATPPRRAEPPTVPQQVRPEAATPSTPAPRPESSVKFTRAGALWTALILGFLVLVVLLVFIAQNTASAQFAFLGWRWSLPLGVAILAAAVCGGLLTMAAGTARIVQLRRAVKRNLRFGL